MIIPKPLSITIDKSNTFLLDYTLKLKPNPYANITADLCVFLDKALGFTLITDKGSNIELIIDDKLLVELSDEGYLLDIGKNGIVIKAADPKGLFYGVQSLKQIIAQTMDTEQAKLPYVSVKDKPKYTYRGYMFDICRHFFGLNDILKVIDTIALHKINTLHLHLTEDQGWRIEIDKYRRLTSFGARREQTLGDGKWHGGYLSKSDIKNIIEYASSKYIEVIPEIDMPGHAIAAIASYNYLSCRGEKISVAESFGIKADVMCPGKESTYKFLYDVMDEVCEMFPSRYIHLGGDEAPKIRWEECPYCKMALIDNNLDNFEQLQGLFLNKIAKYLKDKGKAVICWNESVYSKILDPDIICQYWSDGKEPIRVVNELNKGRKGIISKFSPYYLDYPYAMHSLKAAYCFSPELKGVYELDNIMGVEAPLWTEYVDNMPRAEYMTYPRLGAISETAWTAPEIKDYEDFCARLKGYYKLLDVYNVKYADFKDTNPGAIKKVSQMKEFLSRVLKKDNIKSMRESARVMKSLSKAREDK